VTIVVVTIVVVTIVVVTIVVVTIVVVTIVVVTIVISRDSSLRLSCERWKKLFLNEKLKQNLFPSAYSSSCLQQTNIIQMHEIRKTKRSQ